MKNKYIKHSKISESKFREFAWQFSTDIDLKRLSKLVRLNRNTVNKYAVYIRKLISAYCLESSLEIITNQSGLKKAICFKSLPDDTICLEGETFDLLSFSINDKVKNFFFITSYKSERYFKTVTDYEINSAFILFKNIKRTNLSDLLKNNIILNSSHLIGGNNYQIENIKRFYFYLNRRIKKFYGVNQKYFLFHFFESELRFNYTMGKIYTLILELSRRNPL